MALICSDVERTIQFYQGVLGFPLIELMENRDYKGSSHLFFDIGNGNLLAFFDFPASGSAGRRVARQRPAHRDLGLRGAVRAAQGEAREARHPVHRARSRRRRFALLQGPGRHPDRADPRAAAGDGAPPARRLIQSVATRNPVRHASCHALARIFCQSGERSASRDHDRRGLLCHLSRSTIPISSRVL